MSNINEHGSAAVELVCALIFLLGFVAVIQSFSILAGRSHGLSVGLQNVVEQKMMDAGRPPCILEEFGERFVRGDFAPAVFGVGRVEKSLVYVNEPFCEGGGI